MLTFTYGVTHKQRHANFGNFWSPSSSVTPKWLFYLRVYSFCHEGLTPLPRICATSFMNAPYFEEHKSFFVFKTNQRLKSQSGRVLESFSQLAWVQIPAKAKTLFVISKLWDREPFIQADAKNTPSYFSDLHFLVFQNRPNKGA